MLRKGSSVIGDVVTELELRRTQDPLSDREVEMAREAGIPLAFDPALQGWVHLPIEHSQTELSLRSWRVGDAKDFAELLGDAQVWAHLPEVYPGALSQNDATQMISVANSRRDHHVRAIEFEGAPVGQVRLEFSGDSDGRVAELSYWLGRAHWGKRLGSRAVSAFVRSSFEDRPELMQVEARVHPDNPASARLLLGIGFAFQEKREDADGWHVYAQRRPKKV